MDTCAAHSGLEEIVLFNGVCLDYTLLLPSSQPDKSDCNIKMCCLARINTLALIQSPQTYCTCLAKPYQGTSEIYGLPSLRVLYESCISHQLMPISQANPRATLDVIHYVKLCQILKRMGYFFFSECSLCCCVWCGQFHSQRKLTVTADMSDLTHVVRPPC